MTTNAYREGCDGCRALRATNDAMEVMRRQLTEQLEEQTERLKGLRATNWARIAFPAVIVAAAITTTGLVGSYVYGYARRPEVPAPPAPCQDSAEVIGSGSSQRQCHPDASISIEKYAQYAQTELLLRCTCPHKTETIGP